ncbi:MAG: peptidoglycan DD-metalloendopeptidase family protein [Ruminococcus sp.]|uniref:peptidoglycan DD-metalloendopeptidase family protein n=1 Tax=Ruminococcus sp. TaxID=41978 RepID=UPI001B21617C|nr:peptidoglycan DD-metalloendopeptidase family protein [Ruminococcus sp.]MBO7474521.1 peptidoglycan DD-metalloendopeptidase family protein [Ruminococcus sp.]
MKNTIRRVAAVLVVIALVFTMQSWLPLSRNVHAAALAVWPTESRFRNITTYFDSSRNVNDVSGYHNGIDIEANGGSSIYAAYTGKVTSADWKDGYGYMVIIYHADLGVYTFYAHASQLLVSAGASVNQGDIIAQVGSTGNSSGNHLHFGICDTLQAGWPARTYYDPLGYFTYSDNAGGNTTVAPPTMNAEPECSCTEECAGLYTTKGVVTYLNIRAGHNTTSAVIGEIPAGAEFTVTKGNGEWAHVDYNGKKGYASMAYMQLKSELKSGMTIEGATSPTGNISKGKAFSIKGVITSNFKITKVYGGVYFRSGEVTSQYAEATPNAFKYDLSSYFDRNIVFNALNDGDYTYKITAEDEKGEKFELVTSDFVIGKGSGTPSETAVAGDLNADRKLDISDLVILQDHLLNKSEGFTKEQYEASDLNKDGSVDVFDLVAIKKAIIKASA